jgi:nitrogen fixation NifU-like protein
VADLRELYQSVILDHSRSPRNFGPLPDASAEGSGHNPMCGDAVTVWVRMDGDTIADIHFATPPGVGCAISKASASIMTTAVRGKTRQEAEVLFETFHALVTGTRDKSNTEQNKESLPLGSLNAFGGVSQFPIRVKCATLAWHALRSALGTS